MDLPNESVAHLVDCYLAAWNAIGPTERRALIEAAWIKDARYVDPLTQSTGYDGIEETIAAVQARLPGMRFTRVGTVDAHNDAVRFSWSLSPEGGPPVAKGTDFAILEDGRFRSVTGFFDMLPDAA